ncbi:ABC transporter permease [Humibacter ginsengiterrae]
MIVYVVKRIGMGIVTLFGISIALFGLLHLVPGNATDLYINPLTYQGNVEAAQAAMAKELGLDQPLPVQYVKWLAQVLQGHLGTSYQTGQPVTQVIGERLGATLWLTGTGLIVGLAIGIVFGIIAALRRNTVTDQLIQGSSLLGLSVPVFFLGMIGMYVFGITLRWLPTAGMNTPGGGWGGLFQHLIMPAGCLAVASAATFVPWVRTNMLDVLGKDFLLTARSKGLRPSRIVLRHAFYNSLVPLVNIVAMNIPLMFGGAVIIETLFAWPGTGQMAINAITNRDYPVLMGFDMMIAILVVISNLLADVVTAAIDPRVRFR